MELFMYSIFHYILLFCCFLTCLPVRSLTVGCCKCAHIFYSQHQVYKCRVPEQSIPEDLKSRVKTWPWLKGYLLFIFSWAQKLTLSFFALFCLFFQVRASLCSPGCPRTRSVNQDSLKFRNSPASAFWVHQCCPAFKTGKKKIQVWWLMPVIPMPGQLK